MLQTKDLVKIYKPKKGVPVTALNKVTLKFPEKGMVFLLGKSGSGKSTLLNVLGGLDKYDNGEIIIKGVSSKKFKQKHFDSYRNTYVGFIFQEYNVLDDFTVGANIALAIELQNRKARDAEINEILKEVDLEGFGNRKPNELSGGQKQRVAIARALVKNPQIIMADEPTGALDSNTGKQIFDTLKKLSKNKLVIVVSHDREFAESYADRIIELSDGEVISDVEYDESYAEATDEGLKFNGNVIEIPEAYHITEQDRIAINEYIKNLKGKSALNISTLSKKFKKTDESKIKLEDGSHFKLIKSKLPLKNAFKIGGSSLKHKKFRLVLTILLSCISFGLFGLADTFGSYNHIKTCTNSLIDSGVKYASVAKSRQVGQGDNYSYWRDHGFYLSQNELFDISKNTGVKMHGVYQPKTMDLSFAGNIDGEVKLTETEFEIYNTNFTGFADINEDIIKDMNFRILAGALPDANKDEIAISEYIFEIFKKAKYTDGTTKIKDANGKESLKYYEINDYIDILGKYINIGGKNYWITAIIDTNFDLERYEQLIVKKENKTKAESLVDYILASEFDFASRYSYASVIMTGEGFVDKLIETEPKISNITNGYISFYGDNYGVDSQYLAKLSDMTDEKIIWIDGAKQTLGEKEIIATVDCINYYEPESIVKDLNYANEEQYHTTLLKNVKPLNAFKDYFFGKSEDERYVDEEGYKVVGFIIVDEKKTRISSTVICSDSLYQEFCEGKDSKYLFAVGSMPKGKENVEKLVSYCYNEVDATRYPIQNSVTYELDSINEALKEVAKIFLYIGIGFALFAALMLSNFIGTSIAYKKQEIGILRAIGSRSNDVFRIFFAESFIIAMINFVLSAAGVFTATAIINYFIRKELGVLITILTFDLRQIVLLLGVSILVAFIASYIPVKRIASKRPIDAIRGR